MNFISAFNELEKLYESTSMKEDTVGRFMSAETRAKLAKSGGSEAVTHDPETGDTIIGKDVKFKFLVYAVPKGSKESYKALEDKLYTDAGNISEEGGYAFEGVYANIVERLNLIVKTHDIRKLTVWYKEGEAARGGTYECFHADEMPGKPTEVRVSLNAVFDKNLPFAQNIRWFKAPGHKVTITEAVEGSLTEATEPGIEYYMQTLAWDVDTYADYADMYDDEDNFGPDYTFIGTSEEIIAKLNQIAKTHEFSYINIYQGSDITDNSNCVFNASDVDTATDEEFDKAVVWLNKLIPEDEPFMKQLDISPNGKYAAELTEAVEDEEIEIVDDEPKQTIIECAKCGALVIVDEVEVDEESDLVNVKDECKFCEEKEGYKIIGSVLPYEAPEADEVVDEEIPEEPVEDELAEEDDIIEEDLADVARKVFDKPASTKTQQAWEDELNGEMGEISPKRRKHLERKFAQQRDWEARHTTEVTEDAKAGEAETAVAGTASAGAAETHVAGREELPELPD
jgi:hypothetical protein